jgi:ABC-type dipeptide/oligopeptide/nickel transport system ATPase subunit
MAAGTNKLIKMKNVELYVHSNSGAEPLLIQVSEDAAIAEILQLVAGSGGFGDKVEEDVLVFTEDSDGPIERHRKLSELEVRHRHHLHCHKCHRVKVSVFYNGEHSESFSPAATVKRILKWAIKAFKLTPADAADKILVLKNQGADELPLDAHIGSFTQPHHCAIELCLTAPVEVQG